MANMWCFESRRRISRCFYLMDRAQGCIRGWISVASRVVGSERRASWRVDRC